MKEQVKKMIELIPHPERLTPEEAILRSELVTELHKWYDKAFKYACKVAPDYDFLEESPKVNDNCNTQAINM